MSVGTRDPYTRCPDCGFITKPGSMSYTLTPDRSRIDWGRPVEVTCPCCHARYHITESDVLPPDAVMTCHRCGAQVPCPAEAARPQCPDCGLFLPGPGLSQAQREELRITEGLASLALEGRQGPRSPPRHGGWAVSPGSEADEGFHMDTSATASESRQEDEPGELAHYSTGRLTRRQADTVNAWRALLVPTTDPLGDRPRASRSDAIAAAVTDLLREPPAPLEVARYAYAGMAAQLAAAQQKADPGTAPLYPPVSWYLPADTAQHAEQLRTAALNAAIAAHKAVAAKAQRRHPQPGQAGDIARAVFILGELGRRGLPPRLRQVPRGTLARMAIDRWAARDPRQVVAAAIEHARLTHVQLHRARRDMRTLSR